MGSSKVELSALYFFLFILINILVNSLKQELTALSGIFSLALLHTQMILCYWLLQLGLCDLCVVSVIIIPYNIRLCSMPKKSKCISSPKKNLAAFFIGGSVVDYVDSWFHLGHIISNTGDDRLDIISIRNSFCAQINNVLCYFNKNTNIIIQIKLLVSYCSSHYGAELWDLGNKSIDDVCVTWRKRLRPAWSIPIDTHSDLLVLMCNSIPIFDELCRRNYNFINSCLISDSPLVRSVAVYGVYFGRISSPLGRSAHFCCERFNFSTSYFSQLSSMFLISKVFASLPDDRNSIARLLRDGSFWLPTSFLTTDEVNSLISYACGL